MESDTFPTLQGLDNDPRNFIYACSICSATFADNYEGHTETVHGLSDGINPNDRLVTKLYFSSCCHVFCDRHIEGGGPPFHPAGQKPRAPCPYCVKEKGDDTPRDLYSVRGFNEGEYDPLIPSVWFTVPPITLDDGSKETQALRFQYLSLARYCVVSYRARKPLADALKDTKKQLVTLQSHAAEEHSKAVSLELQNQKLQAAAQDVNALRAELQRLQHLEEDREQFNAEVEAFRRLKADVRDLDIFRENKAAILQYMKLLPMLVEQNAKMKERLSSLGFSMALEPVPNYVHLTAEALNDIGSIANTYTNDGRRIHDSSSTHTAGRSAHTFCHPFTSSDRPLKRQRVDSPLPQNVHIDPPSSRDMMPPPSKPLSRMRSVRNLFPGIRKKLTGNRSTPTEHQIKDGDVQMYDNGHWRDNSGSSPQDSQSLPHENISSKLRTDMGRNTSDSEFSFRASSPVKVSGVASEQHPVKMPTGPSYLHLMDGLSWDNSVELGLKDPRESSSSSFAVKSTIRPSVNTPQNQSQAQETSRQQRWGLGYAFLHQSPNATPLPNDQHYSSPQGKYTGYFSRAHYDPSVEIGTPNPSQAQKTTHQIHNIVSPFFGCNQSNAPSPSLSRITETQPSSRHFAASQSQRYPNLQVTAGWLEPPILNGLSIHDVRLKSRHEPSLHKACLQPLRHTVSEPHEDSHFLRTGNHHTPFKQGSWYEISSNITPTLSRQEQIASRSRMRAPTPFGRAGPPQIRQLPLSMPSALSNHYPVRNQTQLETLQRTGVRSSRHMRGVVPGNTVTRVSTDPFSRKKRRSVRR